MVALYIVIGIAVGAVVLYLLMDRRMDALRIAGGKADIELKMKTENVKADILNDDQHRGAYRNDAAESAQLQHVKEPVEHGEIDDELDHFPEEKREVHAMNE